MIKSIKKNNNNLNTLTQILYTDIYIYITQTNKCDIFLFFFSTVTDDTRGGLAMNKQHRRSCRHTHYTTTPDGRTKLVIGRTPYYKMSEWLRYFLPLKVIDLYVFDRDIIVIAEMTNGLDLVMLKYILFQYLYIHYLTT